MLWCQILSLHQSFFFRASWTFFFTCASIVLAFLQGRLRLLWSSRWPFWEKIFCQVSQVYFVIRLYYREMWKLDHRTFQTGTSGKEIGRKKF